jgi:hypothetical protein
MKVGIKIVLARRSLFKLSNNGIKIPDYRTLGTKPPSQPGMALLRFVTLCFRDVEREVEPVA